MLRNALLATVFVAGIAGTASAVPITVNSTTPTWSNVVGGSNINLNVPNGQFTDVRWGVSQGSGQSGLGFDPSQPPSAVIQTDTTFLLGTLRHYNNPIAGNSAATSVDLSLLTNIQSAIPTNQTFAYRFFIDETPNQAPCAYPSNTPCADKITFSNLGTTNSFTLNGTAYTIELTGFSTDGGSTFTNSFISQEGGTQSAGLYARMRAVPEPASIALFGAGLLGLGLARRRRNKEQAAA